MRIPVWVTGTVLLAVAFAAGIASGVAYERRFVPAHRAAAGDAHDAADPMHHLARQLDLDPAQQRAVSAILSRHQADVDSAWHAVQPHVRASLESASQEITAVLRPDQAATFHRMVATHAQGHR